MPKHHQHRPNCGCMAPKANPAPRYAPGDLVSVAAFFPGSEHAYEVTWAGTKNGRTIYYARSTRRPHLMPVGPLEEASVRPWAKSNPKLYTPKDFPKGTVLVESAGRKQARTGRVIGHSGSTWLSYLKVRWDDGSESFEKPGEAAHMVQRANPRTNGILRHRGVGIVHTAGVAAFKHPLSGKRVVVSQKEGGYKAACRMIDRALDARQHAANPDASGWKKGDWVTVTVKGERVKAKVIRVKKGGVATVDVSGQHSNEDLGWVDVYLPPKTNPLHKVTKAKIGWKVLAKDGTFTDTWASGFASQKGASFDLRRARKALGLDAELRVVPEIRSVRKVAKKRAPYRNGRSR